MAGFHLEQFEGDPTGRIIPDLERLSEIVSGLRALNQQIVLTQGTFDLLHIGHVLYLAEAKRLGDVLIVGLDSDEKVRARKGEGRPIVPEDERTAMLCYQRPVDLVIVKQQNFQHWELIRRIQPDVLLATEETYTDQELIELRQLCSRVVVLEPRSSTSTSAKIRRAQIGMKDRLSSALADALQSVAPDIVTDVMNQVLGITDGVHDGESK
ncbi:adenylyltransferase/cytidyltransferase family protein [bacterium]|nr:MAG: adenylyltransferase/cytidyltransferase family protein [bacterium]